MNAKKPSLRAALSSYKYFSFDGTLLRLPYFIITTLIWLAYGGAGVLLFITAAVVSGKNAGVFDKAVVVALSGALYAAVLLAGLAAAVKRGRDMGIAPLITIVLFTGACLSAFFSREVALSLQLFINLWWTFIPSKKQSAQPDEEPLPFAIEEARDIAPWEETEKQE